jgi:hypothetical protein
LVIGLLDDSGPIRSSLETYVNALTQESTHPVLKLMHYAEAAGVASRESSEQPDIWLVDVDLGKGQEWAGVTVFVDLLANSGAQSVILYSAQKPARDAFAGFQRAGAPFRFLAKDPSASSADAFPGVLAEEIARIRHRWLDECRIMLPTPVEAYNGQGETATVEVVGRGSMTMAQLFADLFLTGMNKQGFAEEARTGLVQDNLLVRYFRALRSDPSATSKAWNNSRTQHSLTSALGHRLLRGAEVSPWAAVIDEVLDDLARFSLRPATMQRAAEMLRGVDALKLNGRWVWKQWSAFKAATSLNLIQFLKTLPGVTRDGCIWKDVPKTSNGKDWRAFAKKHQISPQYFCEPDELRGGIEALVGQVTGNQKMHLSLEATKISGDRTQLTLVFTAKGMRLDAPESLHRGEYDTTSGVGFGRAWQSLRGYGQGYVRSDCWEDWWDPFRRHCWASPAATRNHPTVPVNDTVFLLQIVAPFEPMVW